MPFTLVDERNRTHVHSHSILTLPYCNSLSSRPQSKNRRTFRPQGERVTRPASDNQTIWADFDGLRSCGQLFGIEAEMTREETTPNTIREAVARCWCSRRKLRFGIVMVSRQPESWEVLHSYSVSDNYQEREAREVKIRGSLGIPNTYNGCKWCSDLGLFVCMTCGAINCLGAKTGVIHTFCVCAQCGIKCQLTNLAISVSARGD